MSRKKKVRFWRRALFKKKSPVWAECKADGSFRKRGRGRMQYTPGGKEYRPHNRNLTAVEGTRPVHITQDGRVVPVLTPERPPAPQSVPPGTVIAYTDGSALHGNGRAAAAAWLKVDDVEELHTRKLPHCSADRAELEAVDLVLEKLQQRDRALAIFTDSEFVLRALTGKMKREVELDLVNKLRHQLAAFPAVHVVKVKGHSGVEKNELVHRAAKKAMRESVGSEPAATQGGQGMTSR